MCPEQDLKCAVLQPFDVIDSQTYTHVGPELVR